MGKKIIAVDLNPFSRTAQYAHVTIVDNLARVLPLLIQKIEELTMHRNDSVLSKIIESYDNRKTLARLITHIQRKLKALAKKGIFLEIPEAEDI